MIHYNSKLKLIGAQSRPFGSAQNRVFLNTINGDIEGIFHSAKTSSGVVWISGALGGFDGPSFGIYTVLSFKLATEGINSMRLHYRFPGDFDQCVSDVLLGIQYLRERGWTTLLLLDIPSVGP